MSIEHKSGIPELKIDGKLIPNVLLANKYFQIKEVIANQAFGSKEEVGRVFDDSYINEKSEEDGGLAVDSLDTVEIMMKVEDIIGREMADEHAQYVGQVFHVAHFYDVSEAEKNQPGVLNRWMQIRNKEITDFMNQNPRK